MLDNTVINIIIASILGFLSGLGVGGGSLLMLWLTLVLDISYVAAKGINLLFFIPAAIIVSFFRKKQGALSVKTVMPGIISGCISAAGFAILSKHIETDTIQKLFGILMLLTGIREIFYKPKKHAHFDRDAR